MKKRKKAWNCLCTSCFLADQIKFVQSRSVQVHMAWQLTFGYYCDRGGEWCNRSELGNEVKFGRKHFPEGVAQPGVGRD